MCDAIVREPANGSSQPPFPRAAALALIRRLPAYARLVWSLSRDVRVPVARRAALLGAAVYLVSPIDLVPGIIPIVGQLDDVAVVLGALQLALSALTTAQRQEHMQGAGLAERDLAADLEAMGDLGRWLVANGLRAGQRIARHAAAVGPTLAADSARIGRAALTSVMSGLRSRASRRR
jgi:uncharacterized membrane protein YkvA (DUF1232 family)